MLPAFSLSAEALDYDEHLRAHYFSNSSYTNDAVGSNNLETVGGGFSWNDNSVKFPGGSNTNFFRVRLNNILKDVNLQNGLTITFEGKRNSSNWQRYFELSTDTGFSNGSNSKYLYFSTNGNSKVNNGGETGSAFLGDDGNWHTWTISIKENSFTVYKDGVRASGQGCTINDGKINNDWFNDIKNNGYLLLGASSYNGDGAFDGNIRNFKVYDTAFTSLEARFATTNSQNPHEDISVDRVAHLDFHGYNGTSFAESNGFLYDPVHPAYGVQNYSTQISFNNDDNCQYFRMWDKNDHLVFRDDNGTNIFQDGQDFRIDITMGARTDTASPYLFALVKKDGTMPIQLLKNGNLYFNEAERTGTNAIYSGSTEKYHIAYTLSYNAEKQKLYFSAYGEVTDDGHNFQITREYNYKMNAGDITGFEVLNGSGNGHARFGGITFYEPRERVTVDDGYFGLLKKLDNFKISGKGECGGFPNYPNPRDYDEASNNIVYMPQCDDSDECKNTSYTGDVNYELWMNNIVLMYNGLENDKPKFPVVGMSQQTNTSGTRRVWAVYPTTHLPTQTDLETLYPAMDKTFTLENEWHGQNGNTSRDKHWYWTWREDKRYSGTNIMNNYLQLNYQNFVVTQNRYWASSGNIVTYNEVPNGYYQKYYINWARVTGENPDDTIVFQTTHPIFVLNGAGLQERGTKAKAEIEKITANINKYGEDYYPAGSVEKFVNAVRNILEFNPTIYNYEINIQSEVYAASVDIKNLEKAYDSSIPQHVHNIVTVREAKAPTCTENGNTLEQKCKADDGYVIGGETIKAIGHKYVQKYVKPNGDMNGYTYEECSNDASHIQNIVYDEVDWEVYDEQVQLFDETYVQNLYPEFLVAYTDESIEKYIEEFYKLTSTVDKTDVTKSQKYIDDLATAIMTLEETTLEKRTFHISFYTQYDDEDTATHVIDADYEYDDVVAFKPTIKSGYSAYKWTAEIGEEPIKKVGTNVKTLKYSVSDNAEYIVYLSKNPTTSTTVEATLVNNSNRVYDIAQITPGVVAVAIDGNTITIGKQKLTAPTIPFYTVVGFMINDEQTYNGAINVTSDLTIKPIYAPK